MAARGSDLPDPRALLGLWAASGDSGSGAGAFLGLGVTTVPGVREVSALLFLIRNSLPRTAKLQNLVNGSVL